VTQPSQFILQEAWQQCERHLHHLKHALGSLVLPITASNLSTMSDETVQDWDQFVLRYTKLQDAIGSRLFPAVLTLLQEPYEDKPMIDKLNRLEKLGFWIMLINGTNCALSVTTLPMTILVMTLSKQHI